MKPKVPVSRAVFSIIAVLNCAAVAVAENRFSLVAPGKPLPGVVAGSHTMEQDAAVDLCRYLSRICGRKITVSDKAAAGRITIHVGRDRFVEQHVGEIHKLRADGYVIRCLERDGRLHLVLAGNVGRAAQWAVERFLTDHCGVRWLFPDRVHGEVVPSRKTITVDRRLSKTFEPDFVNRANCGMYFFSPPRKLLRLAPYGDGQYGNHALQYIFAAKQFREHPDWFAMFDGKRQWWSYGNGWQICTTHPGTVDRAVAYIDEFFKKRPNAPVVSVGQNDGNGWCECERCKTFVNSVKPAYTLSERWFHWVNRVAHRVGKTHPGKWVEAMAYSNTSTPPRFQLEPNVAVTKTFVLDSEFQQAEQWRTVCRSVNLYSYMYGGSFLGFRHYPRAAQQFLKWGHDELGALSHITECAGDWTFDGPKYHYIQALQWDVNADVNHVMDEFCEASYGPAAKPMRDFWDRLEEVYERRQPGPYRKHHKDWLFYQWVSWNNGSYVQPNDEFQGYRKDDIAFLDRCIATATGLAAGDTSGAKFRLERLVEAWQFQRSLLVSYLEFYPASLEIAVTSDKNRQAVIQRARHVAETRRARAISLARMRAHPAINPRISSIGFWSNCSAITIFSHENALLDELCSAATRFHIETKGRAAATRFWQSVDRSDSLHAAAKTQLALIGKKPDNRLTNGDFESGNLQGWVVERGQVAASKGQARSGDFSAASTTGGPLTISQQVRVSPFERYRLTAWGRYVTRPPDTSVAMEATVTFLDGQQAIYVEPTRCMLRTLDPADGWTRLRLTVSVPSQADSAVIKLKRNFNGNTLWDDVVLERIRPGPPIKHGELLDTFDGQQLDLARWTRMRPHGGVHPPPTAAGSLVMDSEEAYPVISLARFNDLIKHEGPGRYRLRFHVTPSPTTKTARPGSASFNFSLTNSQTSVTRMLWYFYFSGPGRTLPMVSCFNDQSGVRKFSSSWNVNHLAANREHDLWCTFYFDPTEVTVFAAANGYDESEKSLVCRYKHGLSNMAANGSIHLGLFKGPYRIDEIQLVRPRQQPK